MARAQRTFTDEELAFLAAIHAHPRNDAPRLVYADWLDERGDPRGEFIRLQCQSGRTIRLGKEPVSRRMRVLDRRLFRAADDAEPQEADTDDDEEERACNEGATDRVQWLCNSIGRSWAFPLFTVRRYGVGRHWELRLKCFARGLPLVVTSAVLSSSAELDGVSRNLGPQHRLAVRWDCAGGIEGLLAHPLMCRVDELWLCRIVLPLIEPLAQGNALERLTRVVIGPHSPEVAAFLRDKIASKVPLGKWGRRG